MIWLRYINLICDIEVSIQRRLFHRHALLNRCQIMLCLYQFLSVLILKLKKHDQSSSFLHQSFSKPMEVLKMLIRAFKKSCFARTCSCNIIEKLLLSLSKLILISSKWLLSLSKPRLRLKNHCQRLEKHDSTLKNHDHAFEILSLICRWLNYDLAVIDEKL